MELKLEDDEVRAVLAEAMEKKINYQANIDKDGCWFEVEAGEIDGMDVSDIHNVKFCARLSITTD